MFTILGQKIGKKRNVSLIILVATILLIPLFANQVSCSSETQESIASAFIREALPLDLSRYKTTIVYNPILNAADCTLISGQSTLTVKIYFQNNNIGGCNLYTNGTILYDKQYADMTDVAASFLQKYQTFSRHDSTELTSALHAVDSTKNSTALSGNTTITVLRISSARSLGSATNKIEYTRFAWTWAIQGVNYPIMSISFMNGAFYGFTDTRGIYSIGDTTVNVSEQQAIAAAMESLKTYSYDIEGSPVSGFEVNESRTVAQLTITTKNSTVWYPMWRVLVFLNHVYPGSVKAFSIFVWADSGSVFHIGFYDELGQPPEYYSYPETNDWNTLPEVDNPNPPMNTYAIIIAVSLTLLSIAGVGLFLKRKIK